uniref:Uncharacterized protein LOC113791882 isoform X1 n=2 Tax=Dermatophagoides pteronyssinus TaxID=6956 RepID=A0A6P6XZT6_DERPT|nr:uncharacterized protein LOC113791882 isoform X1 [Dermatophagoides pteronyssinus]
MNQFILSLTFIISENKFGGYLVNGTWVGILRLFAEKVVDFMPHFFGLHSHREQILDTTFLSHSVYEVAIVSSPSYLYATNPLQVFYTFNSTIWLLLLTGFICYSISLLAADLIIRNQKLSMRHFSDLNFILYRSLIGQSLTKSTHRRKVIKLLRCSLLIWMLATLLLRNLFSNDVMASFLANKEQIIDRFDQLLMTVKRNRDYRIIVEYNSSSERFFLGRFPHLQQRIVRINHNEVTEAKTVAKLLKGKHVLITDRWRGYMIKKLYQKFDIHVSDEGFLQTFGVLPIRKDLHYLARMMLVKMSKYLSQTGITTRLSDDYTKYRSNRNSIEKELNGTTEYDDFINKDIDRELTEADNEDDEEYLNNRIISIVYVHILGLTLSLIVFIAESLHAFFWIKGYNQIQSNI